MSIDEDLSQFIKGPAGPESGLSAHLEELEQEVNRLREALQRNRAEHLSYKRRMEEAETHRMNKAAPVASNLLPVLDDLERATGPGTATTRQNVESAQEKVWKEGMELIRDKLMSILEKEGLRKIRATGERFNPVLHEAIAPHPTHTIPEDTIVTVQQDGYTLNGTFSDPPKLRWPAGRNSSNTRILKPEEPTEVEPKWPR